MALHRYDKTAVPGLLVSMAFSLWCPTVGRASAITLGSAQSFAILGGGGVTAAGPCCTIISGNLGDYPLALASITGFPTPGMVVNGTYYASDQLPLIAQQAQADETTAYNALAALPSTANETGIVLGTGGTVSTLLPGVYTFSSSAQVNGALTLNFNNQSNAVFVFQIGSTLTTGSSATINVIGGDSTDAIYWEVGTSATLGSSTIFEGNILALDAITLDPSAQIPCGRALASTQSVTLASTNLVSIGCSGAGLSGAPEPSAVLLIGFGLLCLIASGKVSRLRAKSPQATR